MANNETTIELKNSNCAAGNSKPRRRLNGNYHQARFGNKWILLSAFLDQLTKTDKSGTLGLFG